MILPESLHWKKIDGVEISHLRVDENSKIGLDWKTARLGLSDLEAEAGDLLQIVVLEFGK